MSLHLLPPALPQRFPLQLVRAIVAALRRMPRGCPLKPDIHNPVDADMNPHPRAAALRALSSQWRDAIDEDARARNIAVELSDRSNDFIQTLCHTEPNVKRRMLLRINQFLRHVYIEVNVQKIISSGVQHFAFDDADINYPGYSNFFPLRTLEITFIDYCHVYKTALSLLHPELRALRIGTLTPSSDEDVDYGDGYDDGLDDPEILSVAMQEAEAAGSRALKLRMLWISNGHVMLRQKEVLHAVFGEKLKINS